jgi:hypothetical protein
MEAKLGRLLRDFRWGRMDAVFAPEIAPPGGALKLAAE